MKKDDFKKSIDNINPDAYMGNRLKAKITTNTVPVKRNRQVTLSIVSFCLAFAIIFGVGFLVPQRNEATTKQQSTTENTVPQNKTVNAFIMVASAANSESTETATVNKTLELNEEYPYEGETERQLARKVTLSENYYGFRVTRENGVEIVNIVDGVETTRMRLNSNVQEFINTQGDRALYFDAQAGKYKFKGDVFITNGSLVLSSAFGIFGTGVSEQEAAAESVPTGLNLYEKLNGQVYDFLRIYQFNEYTHFASPGGATASWDFGVTEVIGAVNFAGNIKCTYRGDSGDNALIATFGDVVRIVHSIID